jgi:hypothetical protein
MNAFTIRIERFGGGAILAAALFAAALLAWPTLGFAYTAEQQQACTGDAFRLCGSEIPDVGRVAACMARRQSELSDGCRVYFRAEPAPVRARPLAMRAAHGKKWRQSRRHTDSDG